MVALEISYSKLDYERALRRHFLETLSFAAGAVGTVALTAVGLFLWWASGLGVLSIAFLGLATVPPLIILFCFFAIPFMASRQCSEPGRRYFVELSDEAVEVSTAGTRALIQWDRYHRALVDQYSYLLYFEKSGFTLVPRRLLTTPSARQEFEDLLRRKVKTIVRC